MAASAFGGTTQKCTACEKTVYLVDQLTADNRVYHRSCFRCHHCKGTLKLTNYSSIDGVLYCKPHYDQLFKMTGSLDKSFEGVMKHRAERSNGHEGQSSSRVSSMFVGTQDKCVVCKKTVYPIEKVAVDGMAYHRPCFKCSHGGCVISPSNYVAHEVKLYCKHHHSQLFMAKGNFSQLEEKDGGAKVVIEKPPLSDNTAVEKPLQAKSVAIQKPQQPDNIAFIAVEKPLQPDNVVIPKTPQAENVSIVKPPQPDNVVAPKTPQAKNVSIEKAPQPDNVVAPKTPQAENVSIEKPPQPDNVAAEKPSPDGNGDSNEDNS